jgi:hypothetical protein
MAEDRSVGREQVGCRAVPPHGVERGQVADLVAAAPQRGRRFPAAIAGLRAVLDRIAISERRRSHQHADHDRNRDRPHRDLLHVVERPGQREGGSATTRRCRARCGPKIGAEAGASSEVGPGASRAAAWAASPLPTWRRSGRNRQGANGPPRLLIAHTWKFRCWPRRDHRGAPPAPADRVATLVVRLTAVSRLQGRPEVVDEDVDSERGDQGDAAKA